MGGANTRSFHYQDDVSLAINAFLVADKAAQDGNEQAAKEKRQHLRTIQNRYWRTFFSILSSNLARRRHGLEFADDERLYMDMGLVDARMLGSDGAETARILLEELSTKAAPGCHYLSEWLAHRHQQLQLEYSLSGGQDREDDYVSKLEETRRRVMDRLSDYLTGLPGIPLEVSESMRTGELDNAIISTGIEILRDPKRRTFLRRRNLWLLREQILAKARARADGPTPLRLIELLGEIYARRWRERYEAFVHHKMEESQQDSTVPDSASVSATHSNIDMLMAEARQMRMRIALAGAVEGDPRPEIVLNSLAPRLTKNALAAFLPVPQMFDRAFAELPPIVILPGRGRGFFSWETGCLTLSLLPMVGVDDSVATALAWQRMLDDHLNRGGVLRRAFERQFPGATFKNDFPADYRAWLCRLSKGETSAMAPDRRAFFRDHIGPDLTKPLLPPNLRNIGPQTMEIISRRLERQLSAGDNDVNLHRRLAALYWDQGKQEAARMQFTAAMQSAPNDGETLFAAGMMFRSQGDAEAAAACFKRGAEQATNSLWGIYCQDAAANLI